MYFEYQKKKQYDRLKYPGWTHLQSQRNLSGNLQVQEIMWLVDRVEISMNIDQLFTFSIIYYLELPGKWLLGQLYQENVIVKLLD